MRDGLVALARRRGVTFSVDTRVTGLTPGAGGGWSVALDGGHAIDARRRGDGHRRLSVPQTGSDGGGLELLRGLGHASTRSTPR